MIVEAFHPREVIVDDEVRKLWFKTVTFEIGLLIGQESSSNAGDFVLAMVPIPSESESSEPPIGLSDVSVEWVQEIAQQVDRLLPGGIVVLGLYIISTRVDLTEAVQYLRAMAEAVALPIDVPAHENVHYMTLVSTKDNIHLHSFYNVVDINKTRMMPAKMISPTTTITFNQYRTLIDLEEPIPFVDISPRAAITAMEATKKRLDEVDKQLKLLFRRVENTIAVRKLTNDTNVRCINLLTLATSKSQKPVENSLGSIHGAVSCVAFVSQFEPNATEVAAIYLKRDFVKSMLVRVALARERWLEDDRAEPFSAFKEGGIIQLAQRGLVPWPSGAAANSHFMATVHVFPDENAVKAVESALEILGGAHKSDDCTWIAMENGGQLGRPLDLTLNTRKAKWFGNLYYLLPVVVVLVLMAFQNLL